MNDGKQTNQYKTRRRILNGANKTQKRNRVELLDQDTNNIHSPLCLSAYLLHATSAASVPLEDFVVAIQEEDIARVKRLQRDFDQLHDRQATA
jgi:hypothetical protein